MIWGIFEVFDCNFTDSFTWTSWSGPVGWWPVVRGCCPSSVSSSTTVTSVTTSWDRSTSPRTRRSNQGHVPSVSPQDRLKSTWNRWVPSARGWSYNVWWIVRTDEEYLYSDQFCMKFHSWEFWQNPQQKIQKLCWCKGEYHYDVCWILYSKIPYFVHIWNYLVLLQKTTLRKNTLKKMINDKLLWIHVFVMPFCMCATDRVQELPKDDHPGESWHSASWSLTPIQRHHPIGRSGGHV